MGNHTKIQSEIFEVMMVRNDLNNLPDHPLPSGYHIRFFLEGDQHSWIRVHQETEGFHTILPELFVREFGSDIQKLQSRQFYVCDTSGVPVGTATAWDDDQLIGTGFGRIHWVAVLPDYQAQGLAKALTSRVCRRFQELGHEKALVTTENFRQNAIHIYESFGFEPFSRNDTEMKFWEKYFRGKKPATDFSSTMVSTRR
jgi:ribosomal protein S18 acetylase RimI-like enzyme